MQLRRHHRLAESAAAAWVPLARFIGAERRLGARAERRPATRLAYEVLRFGVKQAWACLFAALMLTLILGTHWLYPRDASLARYDFLVLAALAIQASMLALKLETWEEAKTIAVFHAVGTAMELFKVANGSWIYPEASVLKLGGVPLFSGFMYAAVGSYLARVWRLFDFRFTHHPPLWALGLLATAIYVNFFAHHYVADVRAVLFIAVAVLFARCWVYYRPWRKHRRMPLLLGFGLVALFIWLAENIGTFAAAWIYPSQRHGWSLVSLGKLGSWFLLMIISYALVASLHRRRKSAALRDQTRLLLGESNSMMSTGSGNVLPPVSLAHVTARSEARRLSLACRRGTIGASVPTRQGNFFARKCCQMRPAKLA